MSRLRMGMGDSYGLRITVLRASGFDPSVPTGVTFKITKPSGANVDWPGEIADQDANSCVSTVAFEPDGSSLDAAGSWKVWLQFTAPGESPGPRSEVVSFDVVAADKK